MKPARILAFLGTFPLLIAGATAQVTSPVDTSPDVPSIPNETVHIGEYTPPLAKPAKAEPLTLRNGAVPTGLQGFYDYQSNGGSPAWIRVNPDNPQEIYTTYMLSSDGSTDESIQSSRKVGFSKSTDGGKTWTPTLDIAGIRMGFPSIDLADLGLESESPVIVAHGDPDGSGVRSMFFAETGGSLGQLYTMPRATAGGRTGDQGAGVIWPVFVPHKDNETVMETLGSLSNRTGEGPAPLQVASADFEGSGTAQWMDLSVDSLASQSSGGRYAIDVSPAGKIGIAFHQSLNFGTPENGDFYSTIRFTESTDNGATWTEPEIVFIRSSEENEEGGMDTTSPRAFLDFAYLQEDPHIVFATTVNRLYATYTIQHWSGSSGEITPIATTDIDSTRGIVQYPAPLTQPGDISGLCYPTISMGDDGQTVVVAYMAYGQFDADPDPLGETPTPVASNDGFFYLRVWGVGSTDGGQTWGSNHVLQDWAGDGTDSASIEYPSLNDQCRVDLETGSVEIDMAFQARRNPGMYAFRATIDDAGTEANRGPTEECFQYFQRTSLPTDWFNSSLGVDDDNRGGAIAKRASIQIYPNPTSGTASILFGLQQAGETTVEIYDAVGRSVRTLVDGERLYAAQHLREVDLTELPAGPYRVVVSQGTTVSSQPLNIVR